MATPRYAAFLSYRHVAPDETWAQSLHRQIESYLPPRSVKVAGKRPEKLRVFLDRAELKGAPNLRDELTARLEPAESLIVLCTPRTPASEWVDAEIEIFRGLRPDRIVTVLRDGEPAASIPRSLYDPDDARRQALFVDLRHRGTRRRIEFLRLMAALLGCEFDELVRRERVRKSQRLSLAAAIVAILAIAFVLYEGSVRDIVDASRAEVEVGAQRMGRFELNVIVSLTESRSVDRVGFLFGFLRRQEFTTPEGTGFQRQRLEGDLAADMGHVAVALAHYRSSVAQLELEVAAAPDRASLVRELVIGEDRIGDTLRSSGMLKEAGYTYQAGIDRARMLPPDDTESRRVLAFVLIGRGDLHMDVGHASLARDDYAEAAQIRDELARGGSLDAAIEAATVQLKLGDVQSAMGDYETARATFVQARERFAALLDASARDKRLLSFTAIAHQRVGHALLDIGERTPALVEFEAGHRLLAKLVDWDRENQAARFEYADSFRWLGDAHLADGAVDAAASAFDEAITSLTKLCDEDPENQTWRVGAARAMLRRGDTQARQGNGSAAESTIRAAVARIDGVTSAAGNQELAQLQEALSDLLSGQGRSPEGLECAMAALGLRQQVAAASQAPGDQVRVAWSHHKVAAAMWRLRRHSDALAHQRQSVAILDGLRREDGFEPRWWTHRRVYIDRQLAGLLWDTGARSEAIGWTRRAVEAGRMLVAASPHHVPWRRAMGMALRTLGNLSLQNKDYAAAEKSLTEALGLVEGHADAMLNDLDAQTSVAWAHAELGDVDWERDRFLDAITHYEKCLGIHETLHRAAPQDVAFSDACALSRRWLGELWLEAEEPQRALPLLQKSIEQHEHLAERQPENHRWCNAYTVTRLDLAAAQSLVGESEAAWQSMQRVEADGGSRLALEDEDRLSPITTSLRIAQSFGDDDRARAAHELALTWLERGLHVFERRLQRMTAQARDAENDRAIAELRGVLVYQRDTNAELAPLRSDPRFAAMFSFLEQSGK